MNGDCSSDTASATPSAPSNTGSPVVFSKSASTIVSRSVSVLAPEVTKNEASAASMPTTDGGGDAGRATSFASGCRGRGAARVRRSGDLGQPRRDRRARSPAIFRSLARAPS